VSTLEVNATTMIEEGTAATQFESDIQLVQRAQQGDADAFATLFHLHKSRVYSLCLRMTHNTAEAEDLAQDAFMQVFRKLATFRGDSALSTWLYRVAVNTVLMHFRKKGLKQVSLDESSTQETPQVAREYGAQDKRLSSCVDRLALARAIQKLPAGYRTIFLLHEIHGYEHQEIARILNCSVGNSKSQLHKAKLRMRELLGGSKENDTSRKSRIARKIRPITQQALSASLARLRAAGRCPKLKQKLSPPSTKLTDPILARMRQPARPI